MPVIDSQNAGWQDNELVRFFDVVMQTQGKKLDGEPSLAKVYQNMVDGDDELVHAGDVAMQFKEKAGSHSTDDTESLRKKWKVGSNCRAKYYGDGTYYEAKIIKIKEKSCTVEFYGYRNVQKVSLKHLENSGGRNCQINQIKEFANSAIANMSESSGEEIESEEESTVGSVCHHANTSGKKKGSERDAQQYPAPYHVLPPPGFSVMNSEFADIAPMLVAWYSAGYDTGLYAAQEKKSRAGPHGHNYCQHANSYI
ncbi:survival motor neuron protein [Trichonephila clavipes]|nr:survival motor neuron protein [Trichonephila clavipes]